METTVLISTKPSLESFQKYKLSYKNFIEIGALLLMLRGNRQTDRHLVCDLKLIRVTPYNTFETFKKVGEAWSW